MPAHGHMPVGYEPAGRACPHQYAEQVKTAVGNNHPSTETHVFNLRMGNIDVYSRRVSRARTIDQKTMAVRS